MTCGDIISKVDKLEPNQYDTTEKLEWLSTLDGKIIDQVIRTHGPIKAQPPHVSWPDPLVAGYKVWENVPIEKPPAPPHPDDENEEKPEPKPPYHSPNDELLIKDPYGSEIYQHWLQAQIHSQNSEIVKYNQQTALFQAAYKEWTDMYNRTHMPLGPAGGNRFRF